MRSSNRRLSAGLIAVWFTCVIPRSLAEPLSFSFSGEIDFVRDGLGLDDSVAPGVSFSGTYSFDPVLAQDIFPEDPRVAFYGFVEPHRMLVEIGNYVFATNDVGVLIWNDVGGSEDRYEVINGLPFEAAGRQWNTMVLLLRDRTATALSSDALPIDAPNLADFSFSTSIGIVDTGHAPAISGTLTSLTPEPGTLAMISLGTASLMARRRRRSWRSPS